MLAERTHMLVVCLGRVGQRTGDFELRPAAERRAAPPGTTTSRRRRRSVRSTGSTRRSVSAGGRRARTAGRRPSPTPTSTATAGGSSSACCRTRGTRVPWRRTTRSWPRGSGSRPISPSAEGRGWPPTAPRRATAAPSRRRRSRRTRGRRRRAARTARAGRRRRTPPARSSRTQSPCEGWNSTPPPGHCTLYASRCPRSSCSSATPSSSGTQRADRWLLVRKTSRPPGRRRRAASGSQSSGSHQAAAPCSLTTRSAHPSASGTRCASPWTSGNTGPCCRCSRRAVTSCSPDRSTATVRAPARASQAEKYAVPLASSTTSTPADVAEDAELALRDREQPPHRFRPEPQLLGRRVGEAFVHDGPQRAVQGGLVGSAVGHVPTLGRTGVPAGDPSPLPLRFAITMAATTLLHRPAVRASAAAAVVVLVLVAALALLDPSGVCSRPSAGTGCRSLGTGGVYRWAPLVVGLPVLLVATALPVYALARRPAGPGRVFVAPGPRPSAPSRWPPPRPGSSPSLPAGRAAPLVRVGAAVRRHHQRLRRRSRASSSVRWSRRRRRSPTGSGRGRGRRRAPDAVRDRPRRSRSCSSSSALAAVGFAATVWRGGPVGYAFAGPLVAPTVRRGRARHARRDRGVRRRLRASCVRLR